MSGKSQTLEFQAESRQLLDLMIHSIYSNKEIFLRELISNASDAMDRLRLESLTDARVAEAMKDANLEIRIESDPNERTLTIVDSGIGMSRDEVVNHIGTIARSGTKELIEKLKQSSGSKTEAELIGQFGVGFYSSFMVAEKVTLLTRRAGSDKAVLWESTGDGTYTVSEAARDTFGTTITLKLKPADEDHGIEDYTEASVVTSIVKRYSDFINYPIVMKKEVVKEGDKKELEDVVLNSMKPIWARPAGEVTEEDYHQFYRHISHDWQDPLKIITYKAEGTLEYSSLLFVPSQAPFDLYYQGYKSGLQLYVRRVKIVDDFEDLLPHYLRFVKGVVESADLPLNISREMLQQDRQIVQMRKSLTKKVLSSLAELLDKDRDNYVKFWGQFGNALKEGITADTENKDKLTDLILFRSSASEDDSLTTVREYVSRMKPGQDEIYYMTGDSVDVIKNSPHLEIFREKGYEVLYLTDPVDELVVNGLSEFEGKKLKSVEKGEFDLGSDSEKKAGKKKLEEQNQEYSGLIDLLKDVLKDRVKDVRLTNRLVSAPACLVGDEQDMSPHLEKLLKRANMGFGGMQTKRILELNPSHPIVVKLHERFEADRDSPDLREYGEILTDYAQISEGGEIVNPVRFNELLLKLMDKGLS